MTKKKVKLPLREGTQLPPMTEEERRKRREVGHPLDDFPLSPRMSKWREVSSASPFPTANAETKHSTERSYEHSTKHSTEPLINELKQQEQRGYQDSTDTTSHLGEPTTKRLSKRTTEPLTEPLETKQSKEAYVALDATHTASESKVYSYLYRLSISRGQHTCRASLSEIHDSLGSSKNTIIKAIRGLTEKLSIDVLDRRAGSRIGSLYYVYTVKEILSRRRDAEIEIDDYKRVVPKGSNKRLIERLFERSKTEPLNVQKLNVQMNVQTPINRLIDDNLTDPSRKTKNLLLRNDDNSIESSSRVDDETSRISTIREIYCHLTENEWRDQDRTEAMALLEISTAHIILGICYSLDRATNHHINSLKYCVPSILDHYEAMQSFPEQDLLRIAYAHMMRIKQARKTNQWDLKSNE